MRNKNKIKKCIVCGNTFHPQYGREDTNKFCSRDCYLENRWDNSHKVSKKCKECDKEFISYKGDKRIFCSKKCADNNRKGKSNPLRSNRMTKKCEWCGKEFSRPVSDFHSKHYFCCHSCSAKWWAEYGLHGKRHPNWNGGGYVIYTDGWKSLRKKALKQADYKCERCNKKYDRLEVHHLKPIRCCKSAKEANIVSNVKVLCPKCHAKEEKIARKKYKNIISKI